MLMSQFALLNSLAGILLYVTEDSDLLMGEEARFHVGRQLRISTMSSNNDW